MNRHRFIVCGLLSLQAVLLAWSGLRHSPTMDEPAHLAAGISHWQHGRTDLYAVNPPLVRMLAALPVIAVNPKTSWTAWRPAEKERAEFTVGRLFAEANGSDTFRLLTLARWAVIPLVLLGGWVCWKWAGELFGPSSGLLALLMWCVSPNILAHGALITADAASASMALTSAWLFWHWLKQRTVLNAVTAGVALGIGLLVKSTLVLFCGLWPLIWLVYRLAGKERWHWPAVRRELGGGVLMLATAVLCLNLGYGFEGSFRRLDSFDFVSESLAGSRERKGFQLVGNRFEGTTLAAVRAPVPANFLIGIDRQRKDFESGRSTFINGRRYHPSQDSLWWAYVYGAAVKVPLGTWALALLALPLALKRRNREQLPLLVPGLALLVLVSSQTGMFYFRYLLPAFGFVFVWISQAVDLITRGRAWCRWLALAACGWMTVSSLAVYPHSLAYFNELVGGPANGFRVMNDANLDWGQDLILLREWMDQNPSAKGVVLRYFGPVDPRQLGIDCRTAGDPPRDDFTGRITSAEADWYAISVTDLGNEAATAASLPAGYDGQSLLWHRTLYDREPDVRIGYSIHVYRLAD